MSSFHVTENIQVLFALLQYASLNPNADLTILASCTALEKLCQNDCFINHCFRL